MFFFSDNVTDYYCCYGYCVDLIRYLSNDLEFDYEMYLVPDGLYGILVRLALTSFIIK